MKNTGRLVKSVGFNKIVSTIVDHCGEYEFTDIEVCEFLERISEEVKDKIGVRV